jgi:uncharacterized protein YndB with AHSA1/START domain
MKFVNTARMTGIVFMTVVFLVATNTFAAKSNLNFVSAINTEEAGTGRVGLVEKRDVVITRVFDAPVETVWKAWTDPEFVKRWWGPTGFTSPSCRIDFRVGGKYVFHMRAPKDFQGGQDFYTAGVYKKIVPLQLIEFTQGLSDKDGNPIDPAAMGMPPDFPKEIPSSLVFKRVGSKTELTVTEYGWTAGQMRDMSESGMSECLDKLAAALAKH